MSEIKHEKIILSNSSLNYTKWKGGEKTLLCFHGFGQDHQVFKPIFKIVKEEFTVYSFDIFFHGKSEWHRNEESLQSTDWFNIMQLFFTKESVGKFEVMGFSMGGKFAMITAQLFPEKTNHIHLLAPDGIKTHFSYRVSTSMIPLRKLFKTQIHNPVVFETLVKIAKSLKLLDNYTLRFAETQMKTEAQRQLVYSSWVVFRKFEPDLNKIAALANGQTSQLTIYLGKFDKVINQREINPLVKMLDHPEIKLIESGHSKLIEAVADSF